MSFKVDAAVEDLIVVENNWVEMLVRLDVLSDLPEVLLVHHGE